MPSPFTIERLTSPAHIGQMRALNALFGRAFEDSETYGAKPPSDDHLRDFLAREHVITLVAMAGGNVVGGLVAYELEKFEQARREVYIYDLAVDEAHRRKGIATALIRRLGEIAAGRGSWVIYIQAYDGDQPAIALYEKLGSRETVIHFEIAVPGKS